MITKTSQLKILFLCMINLALGTSAHAQENTHKYPTIDEIDAYIERGMNQLKIPGGAFALIENGEITYMRGFGRLDRSDSPVTPQTPFQIASISKSFTSMTILQLAAEGKFSIDDPVSRHIPYFKTKDPKASAAITIRHLMNHTSGLRTLDGNRYQRTQYRGADATLHAVDRLKYAELHAPAGTKYQYSNANYAMLAHLIEMIEKRPYEEVLEERIFTPLGIKNTFIQIADKPTAQDAKGHLQWFGTAKQNHFIAGRMMMGAGGVTSSVEDLATYLIAISTNNKQTIPTTLVNSWRNNTSNAYEFGWEYQYAGKRRIIFHDGANPGFRAFISYDPQNQRGAVFLMNMSGTHEGSLHIGTVGYALGLPAVDISASPLFVYIFKISIIVTIALALMAIFSIRRLRQNADKAWVSSPLLRWALIIFPSFLLICFATGLWFFVPRSFNVNFSAASLFYPDLGILMLVQIIIALSWAITRVVLLIKR